MSQVGTFKEALRDDLESSPAKARVVAEELDIHYTTLMNALNSDELKFNLQARLINRFAKATGGRNAINWLCCDLGGLFIELPPVPTQRADVNESLAKVVDRFGNVLRKIGAAVDPTGPGGQEVTPDELAASKRAVNECTQELLALLGRLEESAE